MMLSRRLAKIVYSSSDELSANSKAINWLANDCESKINDRKKCSQPSSSSGLRRWRAFGSYSSRGLFGSAFAPRDKKNEGVALENWPPDS